MVTVRAPSRTVCGVVLLSLAMAAQSGCIIGHELAGVHVNQGQRALEKHDLDAALAEFQEAVKLDPQFAEAHFQLGLVQKQKGDLPEAAESLQEAVRLDPTKVEPIFQLGEVYRLLKKTTQAIRAYAMACDLDPRNFELWCRLATCYHQSGDLEKAVEAYQEAIGIQPKNAFVYSNLGAALESQGRMYEAIKAYKQSLECEGADQAVVLVNLATVYLNQDRWRTAHLALNKAIDINPNLSSAHERLGYCLWRQGIYPLAAQQYEKAIQLDPHNAAARAGYGVVLMTQYLETPDDVTLRDRAVETWHISLELNPEQPKLRELVEKYRPKSPEPTVTLDR